MNPSSDPLLVIHNQIENLISRTGDEIYDELFRLEQENNHNIPATENFINNMEVKKITKEQDMTCSICHEKMLEEEEYNQLECGHCFHKDCLKKWLRINNTCPICRKVIDNSVTNQNIVEETIYLTIYFPNRSILYKSFSDSICFGDLIYKLRNYLPSNLQEKLIWIKNINNNERKYYDDDYNLTLRQLNFTCGSKINFMF